MVIGAPTAPVLGNSCIIEGGGTTLKVTLLESTPLACTIKSPVVAPVGTPTTIEVSLQLEGDDDVPLKVTPLSPCCVALKFVPAMVMVPPMAAELGETLVMLGVGNTMKLTPLLVILLTVTVTGPVVELAPTEATI